MIYHILYAKLFLIRQCFTLSFFSTPWSCICRLRFRTVYHFVLLLLW